jgi:hypothetical protein
MMLAPVTPTQNSNTPGPIRSTRKAPRPSPYPPRTPKKVETGGIPPDLQTITVQGTHLPPVATRLDVAAQFALTYSGLCIFHLLMDLETLTEHSTFNECDQHFGHGSYYQSWKENISFATKACYRCGVPYKHLAYCHGDTVGNRCPNEGFQELVRPLAFIVFFSPPLRAAVFRFLGIPVDSFHAADQDYARWLGFQSNGSAHLSNLMEIMFAVASLKEQGELPFTREFEYKTL